MQLTNSQGELTFGNIVEIIRNIEDYTSTSLPQYTKRATINSRTFIENIVCDSEILPDLIRTLMNIYVGFIMTALDMNRYVTNSRTVRDMMDTVASESFTDYKEVDKFIANFVKPTMGVFDNTIEKTATITPADGGAKVVDHNINTNIPSGRIIEVKFGDTRNSDSRAFTVNLFLQMHPTIVSTEVAKAFIDVNFTPSIKQRLLQMSVGEISFWKDFILSRDLIKRRSKAMRNDKSGVLSDMLKRQQNAVTNAWLKLALIFPEKQNIANTILIFDKQSFDKACNTSGLNFNNYNSRQKFFNKTFAMIVVVVDQNYNKTEMYFHGLDLKAEYDFKHIKSAAKADKFDLTDIMKSMSQGMAPRF